MAFSRRAGGRVTGVRKMPLEMQQGPITGPVGGRGAKNSPEDVKVVQYLFNALPGPLAKLDENGICDVGLIARISTFQTIDLRYPKADSRIDPGGKTLKGLVQKAAMAPGGMSKAGYSPLNGIARAPTRPFRSR